MIAAAGTCSDASRRLCDSIPLGATSGGIVRLCRIETLLL
jgi:hypothetical protein